MIVTRAAATVLIFGLACGGCRAQQIPQPPAEERGAADRLRDGLAGVEGVADVEVNIQHELDSFDPSTALITLDDEVGRQELTAVLAAVPDAVADSGLTDLMQATVVLHGAKIAMPFSADGWDEAGGVAEAAPSTPSSQIDPAATARLVLRLADVVGDRASILVRSPRSVALGFEPGGDELSALLHEALDDPVLSDKRIAWRADNADDEELLQRPTRAIAATPGTLPEVLRAYDGIVASYDELPSGVSSFTVDASATPSRHAVSVVTHLVFDPEVSDFDLTPAAWGDRLAPVLAAQVATIEGLGRGASLEVHRYDDDIAPTGAFFVHPYVPASPSLHTTSTVDWVELVKGW